MRIMVVGTFDVDNYGDCIFPDIVKNELEERLGDCDFHLYSPTSNVANIGNYEVINALPGTAEEVSEHDYDAVILAGGEVLTSGHSPKGIYCLIPPETMSAGMRLWMVPALMKAQKNLPVILNGIGAGAVERNISGGISSALRYADFASLRDRNSQAKLTRNGVDVEIPLGMDSAFTIPDLHDAEEWEDIARKILPEGIQPDSYLIVQGRLQYLKRDFRTWISSIRKITDHLGCSVLLIPICYHHSDVLGVRKIYRRMLRSGIPVHKIDRFIKTDETASLIACSIGYCGTSLHGSITAVSFRKPLVVVAPRGGKYDGVLELVGINNCVTEKYSDIPEYFFHSMDQNKEIPAETGKKKAESAFDEIAAIISGTGDRKNLSSADRTSIDEAVAYDQSYYQNSRKERIIRRLYLVIRRNPTLNSRYDNFSAWKNRKNKF